MKLIRQLFRYIRDGFRNIWSNLFMSISSIVTLSLTLTICSLFVLFAHNTSNFTEQLENEIKIFVEFEKDATNEQIETALQLMTEQPHIIDVVHMTKEEEYADFIERIGENDPDLADFFENTSDENPLPDAGIISVDEIENVDEVVKATKEIEGISYVDYGEESSLASFTNITKMIRQSLSLIVVILLVLALFLIRNTIKLTIYARRNELKIMKLVGASVAHVTVPFLIEGLIIGVLGSIVPILVTIYGYQFLYDLLGGVLVIPMFQMTKPFPMVYELGSMIGLISIIVSLLGSFFAVIKYSLKI